MTVESLPTPQNYSICGIPRQEAYWDNVAFEVSSISRTAEGNENATMSASKITSLVCKPPMIEGSIFDDESAHVVHFYREDRTLLDELTRYIGGALVRGGAVLALATRDHLDGLGRRLKAKGLDVAKVIAQGRYQPLEASKTLSEIMANGMPDQSRFIELVGGYVKRANAAAEGEAPRTAIFGELVAVLWAEGKYDAAIRLEELWNELAKKHSFVLRCAYPIAGFSKNEHTEPFLRVCEAHSSVIPEESYADLLNDDERRRNVAELQQKLEALKEQKTVSESEQQLRLLVEAVQDYAIFMLDPEGRVRTWNRGAHRLKGYLASEILGRHFSCFYSEEDVRAGKPQRELEIATRDGRVEDEGWRIRKDGSKFWANVVITVLKDASGDIVGFGKVTRDFTERMLAQRALEKSQRQLQESERSLRQLSLHLLRSQDEQRRLIGRDLHDSLGQYLSVLKMKLDSVAGRVKNNAHAADDLGQCVELIEVALKEVRTISYLLYPPMLEEMGLRSAIPWYLDGFMKRSGIQTNFEISPQLKRLPADTEIALFRVLQESLTNVHRHSGSTTAEVRVLVDEDTVVLQISDAGKGIKGPDGTKAIGVGLRGMSERVRELGGTFELSSTEEGTTVKATVPVTEATEAGETAG
jgi:PAS domain S-box-containing protein